MNMTFWKTFWASLLSGILSTVIAGFVVILIFFALLNNFVSGFDDLMESKDLKVKENTVLHMKLNGPIGDYSYAKFSPEMPGVQKQFGLREILNGLEIAAEDDDIEGVFLNCGTAPAGMANLKEIRDGLAKFQESGKFVVSYSENYTKKAYYLSSVADELYVFPTGLLEFLGLGSELVFVKGALEKLDIEMQVIRGSNNKFKSAVEPLINEKMSDANRKQTMKYLDALWGEMVGAIAKSRNMKPSYLNEIADSVYVRKSGDAVNYKMADGVKYYDEVLDILKEKAGTKEDEDLELLSFEKYASKKFRREQNLNKRKDKNIAVIFAEGSIVEGVGQPGEIGGTSLSEDIRDAREDDDIKAVVLRVNSPGGSALASDVIWREVILTKKKKPVIVSMGDVAASGGYYISCAADKIYAQPNTITGSIGVFGIIPFTGDMFKNKLGITFDRVQTNDHAILSLNKRLDEEEYQIVQKEVDDIYEDFISKVAKGRKMKKAMVDSIGQGRVWAGTDAKEIGLVDEFGGMTDAINYAAEQADIDKDDIVIRYYPKGGPDELVELIETLKDKEKEEESSGIGSLVKASHNQSQLERKFLDIYRYVSSFRGQSRIQARMPYLMWIE